MQNAFATNYYTQGATAFSFNYTGNIGNVDIKALAIAAGWDQSGDLEVRFVGSAQRVCTINVFQTYPGNLNIYIGAGCTVGGGPGSGSGTAAIRLGIPSNNPVQTTITVTNDGKWYGSGGAGAGSQDVWGQGKYNGNPVVWGYGGYSGTGESFSVNSTTNTTTVGYNARTTGGAGSCQSYNGATVGGESNSFTVCGAYGGDGGYWGEDGGWGGYASITGSPGSSGFSTRYSPSTAGYYVAGTATTATQRFVIAKQGDARGLRL